MNKFYLSQKHRVFGGVCGGLAEYTNTDPLLWRVLAVFMPGTFTIYLCIWLFASRKS